MENYGNVNLNEQLNNQSGKNDKYDAMPIRGMGWHKFLVNFSLIASSILCVIYAIMSFAGSQYGADRDVVYLVFPALKRVGIMCGLIYLGMSVFTLYTRFELKGLKLDAPKKLTICYVLGIFVQVYYMIRVAMIIDESIFSLFDFDAVYPILISVAMLFVNNKYYKDREDLFCN